MTRLTPAGRFWRRLLVLMLAVLVLPAMVAAQSQDYEEWSAETRTSLGFRANAQVVRALLPAGWTVTPSAESPDQVNISVTFIDRHVVLDPQGQPVGSGSSRYMVISVQARDADNQSSVLIVNGISPEGSGSYEVYQPAALASAERKLTGQGLQSAQVEENWQMVAESGDSVRLTLRYQQAIPVRRQSSIVIRSGRNTAFTRTYKIDQASDVLGVPGAPGSRIQSLEFRADGPLFSHLFNESAVLTGVTSTPWYNREIYIP